MVTTERYLQLQEGRNSDVVISPIVNGTVVAAYILPVIAEPIKVSYPQGLRKDKIIDVGEVVSFEHRKPRTITIDSFFPENNESYVNPLSLEANGSVLSPKLWANRFIRFGGTPIYVIISDMGLSGIYIINDFHIVLEGSVGKELNYHLSFIQYVETRIRSLGQDGINVIALKNGIRDTANRYLFEKYDSITKMARKTGISEEELISKNDISNLGRLAEGDLLILDR